MHCTERLWLQCNRIYKGAPMSYDPGTQLCTAATFRAVDPRCWASVTKWPTVDCSGLENSKLTAGRAMSYLVLHSLLSPQPCCPQSAVVRVLSPDANVGEGLRHIQPLMLRPLAHEFVQLPETHSLVVVFF